MSGKASILGRRHLDGWRFLLHRDEVKSNVLRFPVARTRPSLDITDGCIVRYVGPQCWDRTPDVIGRAWLFVDTTDDEQCAFVEIRGKNYGSTQGLLSSVAEDWRPIAGADKVWRCSKCDQHFPGFTDGPDKAPDCTGVEGAEHPPHRTVKIKWKGLFR